MKNIIKDACILFAITLVAGILLGLVYNVTKDPIAQQNEKAKQKAYQEVIAAAWLPYPQQHNIFSFHALYHQYALF